MSFFAFYLIHKYNEGMKKHRLLKPSAILGVLLAGISLSGCGAKQVKNYTSFEELDKDSPVIATATSIEADDKIKELIPSAKIVYYTEITSALTNLKNGKWDAIVTSDFLCTESIESERYNVKILGDVLVYDVGLGLSNSCKIPNYIERVNEIVTKFQNDGTMDALNKNWYEPFAPMNMPSFQTKPGRTNTIRCATFGQQKPCSYFDGNDLKGFDIDLAYRIAEELDCNITFEIGEFDSMIMGLTTGKYDMISSNLYVTNDRQDAMTFSTTYRKSKVQMLVNDPEALEFKSLSQLEGKRKLTALTGGAYFNNVKNRYPECEIVYTNTIGDAMLALQNHKVDAFFHDGPVLNYLANTNNNFGVLPEPLFEEDYHFILNKGVGADLHSQFNTWLKTYVSSGRQKAAKEFWESKAEPRLFDFDSLNGDSGTIKLGYLYDARPATFLYKNQITGYPIEVIYEFCKDNNYKPEFIAQDVVGFTASLATNKVDMVIGYISYTEERAENFLYTDVVASGGVYALVRKAKNSTGSSFLDSIKSGFRKTFIDEKRYQTIFKGLGTTLLITVFAFILANLFGAGFAYLSMSKKKVLRAIASIYQYLIQGTPMVVVLMILFYVIFGNVNISGEFVAILGFGLVSGAGLAQQFKGSIQSVDKGQREASLALGFTRFQTFTGVVLPQAVRKIIPGYFAELISLLKATSIVGYISVVDLTKTGDIIRSATFEAFFPLLAIALIYFVVIALILTGMHFIQKALAKKKVVKKEGK